jgi:DNA-binding XRE family transcriptional regulator
MLSKLPEELWEIREASGLSQELLGRIIGKPQKTIEAMENGRQTVDEATEVAWRRACRRYMAFCAVRYGGVPESCAELGDTQDMEDILQEHLRTRREKKAKRRAPRS